jgi:hypothetical protein
MSTSGWSNFAKDWLFLFYERLRQTQGPKKSVLAFVLLFLASALLLGIATATSAQVIPTVSIVSVEADESVTIRTHNYPPNQAFTVTMGPIGTLGIKGTVVATTDSGDGGSFEATYEIPEALQGSGRIAIRLHSPAGYFSFNWFYNNTTGPVGPPPASPVTTTTPVAALIPTFSVQSVQEDATVTIQTHNFPPDGEFVVTMGPIGTRAINGIPVATTDSGDGGSFAATYEIPDEMEGVHQIAIRLQNRTTGYFAYNWFYNNTTEAGVTGDNSSAVGVIPAPVDNGDDDRAAIPARAANSGDRAATPAPVVDVPTPAISIASIDRSKTVTIQARNFPPNQQFVVRIGNMGTHAIDGTEVAIINSGNQGEFNAVYQIPEALKDESRIAIRLESPAGYYAYNWFYNATAP